MGEFASKGVANTGLALGATGLGIALLNGNNGCGGVLGNILGHRGECYETKESAILRQENAILKSENSTDKKILDVYVAGQNELKERDAVIRDLTIAATRNDSRVDTLEKDVSKLQTITEVQNVELADIRVREAETNGRINAVAMTSKQRSEALQREFEMALGCEVEARKVADQRIYDWADCTFARNKKVIPAEDICPSVVTCKDVQNYFLEGNTSATPAATGGTCCKGSSSRSTIDKK